MPSSGLSATRHLLLHARQLSWKARSKQRSVAPGAYNVFTVLGIREQEVKHTALLADLLDPDGSHGLGAVFLRAFLKLVGLPAPAAAAWRVSCEESHQYGRWDIALHGQAAGRPVLLIIENKINAAEGYQQLDRYVKAAHEHAEAYAPTDVWLIFLTPDGRSAESCRQPNGACLLTWSYHQHIHAWLTACLPPARAHARLHHVLVQYLDLLTDYHNQHVQQSLSEQLAHHLLQHDLLTEAATIQDALVQARIELQLLFWQDLEQQLRQANLPLAEEVDGYYSRKHVTDCYRKSRVTRNYGIAIELLRQERDHKQLVLCLDVDRELSFGVYLFQHGAVKTATDFRRSKFGQPQLQQFAEALHLPFEPADQLLLALPLKSYPLQFLPFELETMRQLAQPAERQAISKKLALEAKRLYTKFVTGR